MAIDIWRYAVYNLLDFSIRNQLISNYSLIGLRVIPFKKSDKGIQ